AAWKRLARAPGKRGVDNKRGKTYSDAGAPGQKRSIGTRLSNLDKILIFQGINDHQPLVALGRLIESAANGAIAFANGSPRDQPDRMLRLARKPPPNIGIGHWYLRTLLQAGRIKNPDSYKEVAWVDGERRPRESRTCRYTAHAQFAS